MLIRCVRVCSYFTRVTFCRCTLCRGRQMSACQGDGKAGLPAVHKDQPLCTPCGSLRENGDLRLSLICCLDAFKRGQLEDAGCSNSSEPSPNGVSPSGATAAPDLEEVHSQKSVTGR